MERSTKKRQSCPSGGTSIGLCRRCTRRMPRRVRSQRMAFFTRPQLGRVRPQRGSARGSAPRTHPPPPLEPPRAIRARLHRSAVPPMRPHQRPRQRPHQRRRRGAKRPRCRDAPDPTRGWKRRGWKRRGWKRRGWKRRRWKRRRVAAWLQVVNAELKLASVKLASVTVAIAKPRKVAQLARAELAKAERRAHTKPV